MGSLYGSMSHRDPTGPQGGADKEMDKVLNCLKGRLDQTTAAIQNTFAHERLLALVAAAEVDLSESTEDSSEDSCTPVLWSSLRRHRIVDVESSEAETMPQPRPETTETPEEKLAW